MPWPYFGFVHPGKQLALLVPLGFDVGCKAAHEWLVHGSMREKDVPVIKAGDAAAV